MMWSMWNAPSDRDYYGDDAAEEESYYSHGIDPNEDPLDAYSDDDISLFMTDPRGEAL